MKLIYDKQKIREGIESKAYDDRNLAISKSGKYRFPSKLMLILFLEQFKDIKGIADIWSHQNFNDGTVEIHCDITYKVPNAEKGLKK